jgi:uncharacterized protein (DUF302 family)
MISLLCEDINKATALEATNLTQPSLPCRLSIYEKTGNNRVPVVQFQQKEEKTYNIIKNK